MYPKKRRKKKSRKRPREVAGDVRGEILCPGAVSVVKLVALGVCWWRKGCRDGGPASPADVNLNRGLNRGLSRSQIHRLNYRSTFERCIPYCYKFLVQSC